MGRHAKTQQMLDVALEVLSVTHPMTVRQVYYQLVSRQAIKNSKSSYNSVINALVRGRQGGEIPWEWIEDRLRRPRTVSMWEGLADFADTAVHAYRRDIWATQPAYVEVWLEKDALSGVFEGILDGYGVTLNVGRGYDGWDSIRNAAKRYEGWDYITILYFGDFDPSGADMPRSLGKRLAFFDCEPDIIRCAITPDDISRYNLPPDYAKVTDTRTKAFVARYGNVAVELDALPVEVLRERIRDMVETRLDLDALAQVRRQEDEDKKHLAEALG